MTRYRPSIVVGAVLLAIGIIALIAGTFSSYSTVNEIGVDIAADYPHPYHKSISAKAGDKLVFNLKVKYGRVNFTLWQGSVNIYGTTVDAARALEYEAQIHADDLYDIHITTFPTVSASIPVNGTVSVQRLTSLYPINYAGVALTSLSILFIAYGTFLYYRTRKARATSLNDTTKS